MSDAPSDPKSVRLRGRWVVLILVASLVLNVFFLSTFVPKLWSGGHKCGRGDGVRVFMKHNPDVKELGRRLRSGKRAEIREQRKALRAAYQDYIAAVRAEPFDAERFTAAQSAFVESRRALRSLKNEWKQKLISEMTPEQRKRFAEHLDEQAACRAKRWDRHEKRREERGG